MIATSNPEFLRHVRSELRPTRVAVIVFATLGVALLMGLFLLQDIHSTGRSVDAAYWGNLCLTIFAASSIFFVLWSLLNTTQAVVTERTHRTFDFWRTTRLSPLTLALGKLFGAPLGAWLHYAIVLPLVLFIGLMGHLRFSALLGSYLVVVLFNIAVCAVALCGSMRAPDVRRANILMILIVIALFPKVSSNVLGHDAVSAWTALSPVPAIAGWLGGSTVYVSFFGYAVPSLLVTVMLALVVIAWSLVALVRGIKFEPDQISLFSPSQVVGVSASILLFVYAAFRAHAPMVAGSDLADEFAAQDNLRLLMGTGISAALACLYFTVTATLLTRDNLRREMRKRMSSQIATRIISPWLATGAIALAAAVLGLNGYHRAFAGISPQWFGVIAMYLSITAYALRDGMFLQWMVSQKTRLPVLKGTVLLIAYYVACSVISTLAAGPERMNVMMRWLAPYVTISTNSESGPGWLIVAMLVPPLATAGLIAAGIFRKMRRVPGSSYQLSAVSSQ
jgi:hypothetical protein